MRRLAFGSAAGAVALMTGLGVWALTRLPAGGRVPVHWDAAGNVNGYAGAWALLLAPGIAAAVTLLLFALPWLEPRRTHLLASTPLYHGAVVGINALMLLVQVGTVAAAVGGPQHVMPMLILPGVGLLFAGLGFLMRHSRSNFFMGIRTPWTLTSEITWRKTHELGGWLFVGAGLLVAACAFLPGETAAWVVLCAVMAAVIAPVVYSYLVWRRAPDRTSGSGLHLEG